MSSRRPHKHLIVDAFITNPPTNEADMKAFLVDIIESIGMTVATLTDNQPNPIAWYCAEEGNEGMTATAILTTSHIALHVWDNVSPAELHFDLYSCSDFDAQAIVQKLVEKFGLYKASCTVRDRLASNMHSFEVEIY